MNITQTEPALFYSLLASIAVALLQVITQAGWVWSVQHVLQVVAPLVAGFLTRFVVTSPATLAARYVPRTTTTTP